MKEVCMMVKARHLIWNSNVVIVNNQSHNNKKNLLFADWLFATTTFSFHIK